MLDGQMMTFPLTITHLLERARAIFPDAQVVSRRPDKSLITQTYRETYARAEKLGRALGRLGVSKGGLSQKWFASMASRLSWPSSSRRRFTPFMRLS